MREILFRGKLIMGGEWVTGMLAAYNADAEGALLIVNEILRPVDFKTIGQYTGLTDKNGAKIFEGDILKVTTEAGTEWEESYKTKVTYDDGAFAIDVRHCDYDCTAVGWAFDQWDYTETECEVIGNIHDNPELMSS